MTPEQQLRARAILLVANRKEPTHDISEVRDRSVDVQALRRVAMKLVANRVVLPVQHKTDVQVAAPYVAVAAPSVNVAAPNVSHQSYTDVAAPYVNVAAPTVNIAGSVYTPVIQVDMQPVADALNSMSDMVITALQGLAERPPMQFRPKVVLPPQAAPTAVEVKPAPQQKRTFVIEHDDGTESTVRET